METPRLEQLLSAYFHQDFFEVHGGVWETVDAFVADDPDGAGKLAAEITWVLDHYQSEGEVDGYLDRLGCEYRAQPEDNGYRGWLTEIARRVTEATRAAGRQP